MANEEIVYKVRVEGTKDQEKQLASLEKNLSELTKERRELNKQIRGANKITDEQAQRLSKLNTEILATKNRLNDTRQAVLKNNNALRKTGGLTNILAKGFKRVGAAISGAFIGLFAVQKIAQLAGSIVQLGSDISDLRKQVEDLTGVTGEANDKIVSSVKAIGDTFEKDYKEVLVAANTVSQQFGITTEEALDKIKLGFAAGADANGEFLDILKEYPALLAEVGLNADETFAIITQTTKEGIYSDKGIDAIKEAGLRLRELPKATKDALDGIGLSSKEIEKSLTDGTQTVFNVIQKVGNKLNELPPQSAAVGTAIADIFGGPGEDAGLKFLQSLGSINTEFEDLQNNLTETQQAQLDLADAQEELNNLFVGLFGDTSTGFTKLKTALIEFASTAIKNIVSVINGFIDVFNESEGVRKSLFAIQAAFKTVFEFGKLQVSTAITAFKGLGRVIGALLDGEFSKIADIATEEGQSIIDSYVDFGKGAVEEFSKINEEASKSRIEVIDIEKNAATAALQEEVEAKKKAEEAKTLAQIKESNKRKEEAKKEREKEKKEEEKKEKKKAEALKKSRTKLTDEITSLEEQNLLDTFNSEEQLQLKKLELAKKRKQEEINSEIGNEDLKKKALLELDTKYENDKQKIEEEFRKRKNDLERENNQKIFDASINAAQNISNSVFTIQNQGIEREKNRKLKSIEAQFEAGKISQEQLDAERNKIERKAFERKKKLDTAQAFINGALAITRVIADTPKSDFGISTAILVAATAAQTAAQIAVIQRQTFADGGYTGGGAGYGKDHTGHEVAGVVHKNEYVVPQKVLSTPEGSNMVRALEGMRLGQASTTALKGFANGGFTSANAGGGVSMASLQGIGDQVTQAVVNGVGAIKVVNVASETATVNGRVVDIENTATF